MNRKALYYGLLYTALVIVIRLFVLLGGYSLTRFGFFYSLITGYFLIIPFYIFAIRSVRDKNNGGIIAGKEALRIALTVFAVSAIIISVYNYAEFELAGKELAKEYYRSEQYLDFLKSQAKVKPETYQQVIEQQIVGAENDAFRATTGKLFSFMLIGLSSAFLTAMFMKRGRKTAAPHLL